MACSAALCESYFSLCLCVSKDVRSPSRSMSTPAHVRRAPTKLRAEAQGGAMVASERKQELTAVVPVASELSEMRQLDDDLSCRPLDLDPSGYFIIRVDWQTRQLVAEHFLNVINSNGLACDPETGHVIPCNGSYRPTPAHVYRGKTAKEVSVAILEPCAKAAARDVDDVRSALGAPTSSVPVSMLTHANYLGRELQKAEQALVHGLEYIQD
eukprot:TRINITY_DN4384_c0_g4_i1.p1 TRINITY_DN4384_c0_g4~~TRINITY_DN4384_c0_g4_i1.p1  ORF type:complete len:225 (-),score=51.99 TRINITY_DN4384_c0_g4_i1:91-726(-)